MHSVQCIRFLNVTFTIYIHKLLSSITFVFDNANLQIDNNFCYFIAIHEMIYFLTKFLTFIPGTAQ